MAEEEHSKNKVDDNEREVERRREYKKQYKKQLSLAGIKESEKYDRAVLGLSGGALGVSIIFIKDILQKVSHDTIMWLISAWICLGLSMVILLSSSLASQYAIRHAIKQLSKRKVPKQPGGKLAILTACLSFISGVLLVTGIVLLGIFLIINVQEVTR